MCILAWHFQPSSPTPLLLIGNRDEYASRPAAPLHFWETQNIWAGKDLVAEGTWLGLDPDGRCAAITNHRTGSASDAKAMSRGHIITQFFAAKLSAFEFANILEKESANYQPFNLLLYDRDQLIGVESRTPKRAFRIIDIPPGFDSVSNGSFLETWPKTERLTQSLKATFKDEIATNDGKLFEILCDPSQAPDPLLPDTGLPKARERDLSSIFVSVDGYGTRAQSIVRVTKRFCSIVERSYDETGAVMETRFKQSWTQPVR